MITELTNKERQLPRILFASIVIMLLPFIVSYNLFNMSNMITPLLAGAYVIQLVLMVTILLKYNNKIHIIIVVVAFALLTVQCSTLFIDSDRGLQINFNDYINVFAKFVNFLLLFGIIFNMKVKKKQIQYFMKYMTVFAVIACVYNIAANWMSILNVGHITSSYQLDLKSFFANRNQFGSFVFMSVIAHCYVCSNNKVKKINVSIFVLQLLSLVMIMSRGAILACIVFFVVLYLQYSKNAKVTLGVMTLCSIGILIMITNSEIMAFISKFIIRVDSGTTGRNEIWTMGYNIAADNNMISGVGYYTGLDMAKSIGFEYGQFHSLFIDTLVGGGIIELLFIVFILLYILRRCIKKCRDSGYKKVYIASAVAMWSLGIFESVSFFSIGYVDTIFTIFFVSIPLLLSNMDVGMEYSRHVHIEHNERESDSE